MLDQYGEMGPISAEIGPRYAMEVRKVAITLYVGNLPWSITEDELTQAFSAYADVKSCRIITDRETGRSRGFGFVEVADEDAPKAIEGMNGTMLGGREILVNEAKARQARF